MEPDLKSHVCIRLKRARIEAGFASAKEFSLRNDLKISTYALHEAGTRGMSLEVIECYAQLLHINSSWLLTGVGPKEASRTRVVPIIDWQEVPLFLQGKTLEHKAWTHADTDLHQQSFGLTVQDDAMEPRYPQGTIIITDSQQKPRPKDFTLFMCNDKKMPFFKQLVQSEGKFYAKSLNSTYPPLLLTKNIIILGKVIQAKLVF